MRDPPWVGDAVLLLFQKMHNEVKRRGVRSSEMKKRCDNQSCCPEPIRVCVPPEAGPLRPPATGVHELRECSHDAQDLGPGSAS